MPSPGYTTLLNEIGATAYTVEGGYNVSFTTNNLWVQELATAIHAGWTSSSPTTSTTMHSSFNTRVFASYAGYSIFVECIAIGIDDEVNAWVASWDSVAGVHTYIVTASNIYNRIIACATLQSNGTHALAQSCANTFAAYFGQEVG